MTVVAFTVRGSPAPQGSKKAFPVFKGTGATRTLLRVNVVDDEPETLSTWREAVKGAAMLAMTGGQWTRRPRFPIDQAVALSLTFTFRRPASHFRTGQSTSHLLSAAATLYPHKTGKVASGGPSDLDKLARGVMDALTDAGLIADDALVCKFDELEKVWVGHPAAQPHPGVSVIVRTMDGHIMPVGGGTR